MRVLSYRGNHNLSAEALTFKSGKLIAMPPNKLEKKNKADILRNDQLIVISIGGAKGENYRGYFAVSNNNFIVLSSKYLLLNENYCSWSAKRKKLFLRIHINEACNQIKTRGTREISFQTFYLIKAFSFTLVSFPSHSFTVALIGLEKAPVVLLLLVKEGSFT